MIIPDAIEQWICHANAEEHRPVYRHAYWNMRSNPTFRDQVFEHLEHLHNHRKGHGTRREFLQASLQLFPDIGQHNFTNIPAQVMLNWNNKTTHSVLFLRPVKGGHKPQRLTYHVTQRSRWRKQNAFVAYHTRRLRKAGLKPPLAKAQAQAIVVPAPVSKLAPSKRQKWRTITQEQFADCLNALARMRLTECERHLYPALLHLLHENGARRTAFLPCKISNLQRDAQGRLLGIMPPPAPANKQNPPLTFGAQASSMEAWLKFHPDASNPDAPLFLSPDAQADGTIEELGTPEFTQLLWRIGRAAGLPFGLGVRCFRRLHHAEAAARGANDETMRALHGHGDGSPMPSVYTRFDHDQAMRVMARLRGNPIKKPMCKSCRHHLRPGDVACTWCGLPTDLSAEPNWHDPIFRKSEAIGRLGLEALECQEAMA